MAHRGHTGSDADRILLGNAAVKVTIRVLPEDFGFGGGQVGVKNHQIISALRRCDSTSGDIAMRGG